VARSTDAATEIEALPDGEPAKTMGQQEALFRRLAARHLERTDPLVALGDDALLEAATFSAGVWLRGVSLVTVPITTLGLIDTAIGGKGSIDLPGVGHNLLGTIQQPTATILDVDLVADEAPDDRWHAMAEVVKYGLVADPRLLAVLEAFHRDRAGGPPTGTALLEIVERCALIKRRYVLTDERDRDDVRIALNLGHTTSHALETATEYRLSHGEAVGYGLRVALGIGRMIDVTPPGVAARAARILDQLGLGGRRLDVSVDQILSLIENDKKRVGDRTRWVLVGGSGIVVRDDLPDAIVRTAIEQALSPASSGP
jgi:3-dehydroquinate synthase